MAFNIVAAFCSCSPFAVAETVALLAIDVENKGTPESVFRATNPIDVVPISRLRTTFKVQLSPIEVATIHNLATGCKIR